MQALILHLCDTLVPMLGYILPCWDILYVQLCMLVKHMLKKEAAAAAAAVAGL